jgi:hypothetical protein
MAVGETGPGGHLLTAWNLADVNNVATAVANLGGPFLKADANGIAIGQVVAQANGPGSQTDYSTAATVFTVVAPMINGQQYEISLKGEGTQVTNASTVAQVYVSDSLGLIPTTFMKGCMAAIALNGFLGGGASQVLTATSTASNTFTITASSASAAYRIAAHNVAFSVKRVS